MSPEELDSLFFEYVHSTLTPEEENSFKNLNDFHIWAKETYKPIGKEELIKGETYSGICRNASKAIWDGKEFHYKRFKFGLTYDETINHYEDDNDFGYDVFVPIKKIK